MQQPRKADGDGMKGAWLGPAFAQTDIESRLRVCGARFETLDDHADDAPSQGQVPGVIPAVRKEPDSFSDALCESANPA
jgi:hypothetical protein